MRKTYQNYLYNKRVGFTLAAEDIFKWAERKWGNAWNEFVKKDGSK